jgi:hypothetical protein
VTGFGESLAADVRLRIPWAPSRRPASACVAAVGSRPSFSVEFDVGLRCPAPSRSASPDSVADEAVPEGAWAIEGPEGASALLGVMDAPYDISLGVLESRQILTAWLPVFWDRITMIVTGFWLDTRAHRGYG